MATPISRITKEEKAINASNDNNRIEYGHWIITLEKCGNSWYFEVGSAQDGELDHGVCISRTKAIESAKQCANCASLYPRREW